MVDEHLVDEPLVGSTSVLEPEGFDFVTKNAPLDDEGNLLLVFWVHEYLVIDREGIHEAKKLMTNNGVKYHIDVRKWEGILGKSLVEVVEIDAYSPLIVLLLYYDNIGKPFGVLDLTDGKDVDQLLNLFIDDLVVF